MLFTYSVLFNGRWLDSRPIYATSRREAALRMRAEPEQYAPRGQAHLFLPTTYTMLLHDGTPVYTDKDWPQYRVRQTAR